MVNVDSLQWSEGRRGDRYEWRRIQLGAAAGGEKLGCSLYEIPPGRRAFPYHSHLANEEAIYVLAGQGTLLLGDRQIPVRSGDYIALPAGEATAHQLINDSAEPLRYLCFSTMIEPDVTVYPDTGKVGLFAGAAPGGPKEKRTVHTYLRTEATVDYWEGEE